MQGGVRRRWWRLAAGATSVITVSTFALTASPARAGGTGRTGAAPTSSVRMPLNVNGRHVFWPSDVNAGGSNRGTTFGPGSVNNLIYHGGAVERTPKAYLIFWGQEWDRGNAAYNIAVQDPATHQDYTLGDLQNYITSFFTAIGQPAKAVGSGTTGARWAGIQAQYCQGGSIGDVTCGAGTAHVTNPSHVLGGVWKDDSSADTPPQVIDTLGLAENLNGALDPVATEAVRAARHFGASADYDATFIVFGPPGRVVTGFYPAPYYCGYHSEVQPAQPTNSGTGLRYAFIPYILDVDLSPVVSLIGGCGMNYVNTKNDASGHGIFDGFSIVAGHEFAEAVTDPDNWPPNYQDGWNDVQTSENGDKCAWMKPGSAPGAAVNMYGPNSTHFAVQGLWSNAADGGAGRCSDG